jgi:hypothetical protein
MSNTTTYQVITYDVWGNAREGFEVNAAYTTDTYIEVSESTSDRAINRRLGVSGISWDGEPGFTLYGTVKRNGMPALELRAVNN